jgi:hypothetical protein
MTDEEKIGLLQSIATTFGDEGEANISSTLFGLASLYEHREDAPESFEAAIRAVIGQTALMGKRLSLDGWERAMQKIKERDES